MTRHSPARPFASRALARLQDESGIALVMALGVMLVLAIVLTTTIFFTSASLRHANSSNAGQKAYAIAEAGLERRGLPACAVLHGLAAGGRRHAAERSAAAAPSRSPEGR